MFIIFFLEAREENAEAMQTNLAMDFMRLALCQPKDIKKLLGQHEDMSMLCRRTWRPQWGPSQEP